MMRKTVLAAIVAVLCWSLAAAQETREWKTPAGLSYGNEIGLRYGAQLYTGKGHAPELQAFSVDYARFNYYNIGFRTGVNIFLDDGAVNDYFSIPMQFAWRSGRLRDLFIWPGEFSVGSFFAGLLSGIIPKQIELHTGFTPGMILGKRSSSEFVEWYRFEHRFTCTYDLGLRLIIPVWRFNIFGDFTYHCYLTDNFRYGGSRPSRSFMGLGGGLSFNF